MYLNHYHLKAKPFDLSPSPRFLWLGEKHKEALSTLTYGIVENSGFLLLTGDVGAGKTALIYRLISSLDASTIVAHITDPELGTIDFFKMLAAEFGITGDIRSKADFLIQFENFLLQAYSENKKILLVVDEAQRISNKLLDQIRVLSNIELSDRKLINIFFVGQPEFKNMLMDSRNRAIRQRIAINYHINPLTEQETGQYIEHRLKVAGATQKIFKPEAGREVFRFTAGYPRAINIICDHALITGYASGLKSIDVGTIKECEQELNMRAGMDFGRTDRQMPTSRKPVRQGKPSPRQSPFGMYAILLMGLVVALGTLAGYLFLRPAPQLETAPIVRMDPAASSSQQAPPAAKDPQGSDAPTGVQPVQASREKDVAPAQPVEGVSTPGISAPQADTVITEPQQAVLMAQPKPASDLPPQKGRPDSRLAIPASSTAQVPQMPVPSDLPQEAKPDRATPDEVLKETAASQRLEEKPVDSRQAAAITTLAEPVPDRLPEIEKLTSGAALADTADKDTALPAPAADAEPPMGTDAPTQGEEIKRQTVSIPEDETTLADRQPAIAPARAAPASAPLSDTREADNNRTISASVGGSSAAIAGLSKAQPQSTPARQATVGETTGKSATDALNPANNRSRDAAESESIAKGPSQATRIDEPSAEASSINQNQAAKTGQPESVSPGDGPEPTAIAKAETQRLGPAEPINDNPPPVKKLDETVLENRLRTFLQNYCTIYASKDLTAFTRFFTPGAEENGKPFESLLPKYQRNFNLIEAIQYRIELQQFSSDENGETVNIEGDFFLKWLPPDRRWRENSGKIYMSLKADGPSFMVQRLDYHGNNSRKKDS
jgi:general secretion pathway protein A